MGQHLALDTCIERIIHFCAKCMIYTYICLVYQCKTDSPGPQPPMLLEHSFVLRCSVTVVSPIKRFIQLPSSKRMRGMTLAKALFCLDRRHSIALSDREPTLPTAPPPSCPSHPPPVPPNPPRRPRP